MYNITDILIRIIIMEGKEMKAKVGVVGAGTYGSVLINAYYGAHRRGEIEFAAIADINPIRSNLWMKSMESKGIRTIGNV